MKKSFSLSIALLASVNAHLIAREQREYYGKSYLRMEPMFQIASPEMPLYREVQDKEHIFDAVVFGSSTGKSKRLGDYFSPTGSQPLKVSENDDRTTVGDFDLLSTPFGVITSGDENYLGTISFEPSETRIGVGFSYYHRLWSHDDGSRYAYIHVSLPIEHVKHDMHFCENKESGGEALTITKDDAGTPLDSPTIPTFASMREALQQNSWCFGKIRTCGDLTSTGVADISARIAYAWQPNDTYAAHGYIGILVPTGDAVKGEYLFEPIVGHGKHAGLMTGARVHGQIWYCQERDVRFNLNIITHSLYLFSKTQRRSLDLKKNGRWSRYLEVYANKAQAEQAAAFFADGGNAGTFLATPGINVFTRDVHVKPGLSHTINASFSAEWEHVMAKLGYVLYAQSNERVRLCKVPDGVALKSANGRGLTQPLRTIDSKHDECPDVDLADYDTSVISEQDLDLSVASTPASIHNTLYGSVNYNKERWHGSVGASYTFKGSSNAVPHRWALWVSCGYDV